MTKSRSTTPVIPTTPEDKPNSPAPAQSGLAVFPCGPYPSDRVLEETEIEPAYVDLWGYCVSFCAQNDMPVQGASVDEHGPWCTSTGVGVPATRVEAGTRDFLSARLHALYTHGLYERQELDTSAAWNQTLIVVSTRDDDPEAEFALTVGDARGYAAALLHLADAADRLLDDPNRALVRRKGART